MTNLQLKAEADRMLYGTGLHELLTHFTSEESIYISGSYALDTMAWRDLDLYIAVENIKQQTKLKNEIP